MCCFWRSAARFNIWRWSALLSILFSFGGGPPCVAFGGPPPDSTFGGGPPCCPSCFLLAVVRLVLLLTVLRPIQHLAVVRLVVHLVFFWRWSALCCFWRSAARFNIWRWSALLSILFSFGGCPLQLFPCNNRNLRNNGTKTFIPTLSVFFLETNKFDQKHNIITNPTLLAPVSSGGETSTSSVSAPQRADAETDAARTGARPGGAGAAVAAFGGGEAVKRQESQQQNQLRNQTIGKRR